MDEETKAQSGAARPPKATALFSSPAVTTKHHRLGGLKRQKSVISQLRRREAQSKDVTSTVSFRGRIVPLSQLLVTAGMPWLVDMSLQAASLVHVAFTWPPFRRMPVSLG